jgi:hypothetical protein
MVAPNVVVEWLAFLLGIRQVPVQISARKPVVLIEVFVAFLSLSRQIPG